MVRTECYWLEGVNGYFCVCCDSIARLSRAAELCSYHFPPKNSGSPAGCLCFSCRGTGEGPWSAIFKDGLWSANVAAIALYALVRVEPSICRRRCRVSSVYRIFATAPGRCIKRNALMLVWPVVWRSAGTSGVFGHGQGRSDDFSLLFEPTGIPNGESRKAAKDGASLRRSSGCFSVHTTVAD